MYGAQFVDRHNPPGKFISLLSDGERLEEAKICKLCNAKFWNVTFFWLNTAACEDSLALDFQLKLVEREVNEQIRSLHSLERVSEESIVWIKRYAYLTRICCLRKLLERSGSKKPRNWKTSNYKNYLNYMALLPYWDRLKISYSIYKV